MQRALFFLTACILIIACQKEISKDTTNKTTNAANCRLVKMVQGTGVNDTIYLLKYDNLGRVIKIVDSSYGTPYDLINVTYNGSSKLPSEVDILNVDSNTYTYNNAGKVTQWILRDPGFIAFKYVFEYTSDTILTKVNTFEWDDNINDWSSNGYTNFTFDGKKDLTQVKEFADNGTLASTQIIEYADVQNTLKGLLPFDVYGVLGIWDIFPEEWYYYESNFMAHTYNDSSSPDYREYSYNVDSLGNVTSSTVFWKDSPTAPTNGVTTRKYFYDCTK